MSILINSIGWTGAGINGFWGVCFSLVRRLSIWAEFSFCAITSVLYNRVHCSLLNGRKEKVRNYSYKLENDLPNYVFAWGVNVGSVKLVTFVPFGYRGWVWPFLVYLNVYSKSCAWKTKEIPGENYYLTILVPYGFLKTIKTIPGDETVALNWSSCGFIPYIDV